MYLSVVSLFAFFRREETPVVQNRQDQQKTKMKTLKNKAETKKTFNGLFFQGKKKVQKKKSRCVKEGEAALALAPAKAPATTRLS